MDPAVIALVGTIFGGVGLKIVESVMSRGSSKDQTAAQIRAELRGDLQGIKAELLSVQNELDEWKSKYYNLLEQLITVKSELEGYTRLAKKQVDNAEHAMDSTLADNKTELRMHRETQS